MVGLVYIVSRRFLCIRLCTDKQKAKSCTDARGNPRTVVDHKNSNQPNFNSLTRPLDVWEFPGFVEQRLLRSVQAEKNLEFPDGAGRNPIRLFACRSFWRKINIHRTVRILLKIRILGRAVGPLHVADERVCAPIINRCRPILSDGSVCRDVQAIRISAVESVAILIGESHQIKLSRAQVLGAEEANRISDASVVDWIFVGITEEVLQSLYDIWGSR